VDVETCIAPSESHQTFAWQIGTLYTRAGKNDEAHDGNMPYISVDPIFDGLRDDSRFQDLLRRMNLPEGK
jgi:hypothetical protein